MGYIEGMFDLEEYPVEIRIRIFAAQVNAAAGVGTWCFLVDPEAREDRMFYSTCVQEKEYLSFLQLGNSFEFLKTTETGWEKPVILSDPLGMVWVAENTFREDGKPALLIALGPIFLSHTSATYIDSALRVKVHSDKMRNQMAKTMTGIPVLSVSAVDQYAKMLHFSLTSNRVRTSEFYYQDERTERIMSGSFEPLSEHDPDRVIESEREVLQAVREGNMKYKDISEKQISFNSDFICDTGDPIRDAKNSVIVFTVMCSRAAMDGGFSISSARQMEKRYIEEIEKCTTYSKLKNLKNRVIADYIACVRGVKQDPLISKSIREACDYIRVNVQKPMTVEDIAEEVGYSPYYFTKKFNKEMGMKVSDYIKEARIHYAKVALITTNRSIQDISDSLQFGNRNYFSKVFREIVGVTPAAYRNQIGQEEGSDET